MMFREILQTKDTRPHTAIFQSATNPAPDQQPHSKHAACPVASFYGQIWEELKQQNVIKCKLDSSVKTRWKPRGATHAGWNSGVPAKYPQVNTECSVTAEMQSA